MFYSYVPAPPTSHSDVSVGGLLGQIPSYSGYLFPKIPLVLPCVVTVCQNCGFVEHYNIHVLGLAEALDMPPAGSPLP